MIPRSQDRVVIFREKAIQNGYDDKMLEFFDRVLNDHSELRVVIGRKFAFRTPKTVVVGPYEPSYRLLFLHEVGHAISPHQSYKTDMERLKIEMEAWDEARKLAGSYGVEVNEELIQSELDTYRNWLHQKSRCPRCGLTRFQTPDSQYHCPLCEMCEADKK